MGRAIFCSLLMMWGRGKIVPSSLVPALSHIPTLVLIIVSPVPVLSVAISPVEVAAAGAAAGATPSAAAATVVGRLALPVWANLLVGRVLEVWWVLGQQRLLIVVLGRGRRKLLLLLQQWLLLLLWLRLESRHCDLMYGGIDLGLSLRREERVDNLGLQMLLLL